MSEYTEPHFRNYYVGGRSEYDPGYTDDMEALRAWDAYMAQVRRDAARSALDGLIAGWSGKYGTPETRDAAIAVRDYRDTHYPEEGA